MEKPAPPESSTRSRISSASSPAPFTPSARACCASAPSNPACLRASPSWTRCRTWSFASARGAISSPSARSAGDPDMLALLDADVRPKDLDSAFATICLNEDVEFPPGDADCPDPKRGVEGARDVLEGAAEAPAGGDRSRDDLRHSEGCRHVPRPDARVALPAGSAGRHRVVAARRGTASPGSSRIRWANSAAEKKRFKHLISALHADFHSETVAPYLAQWRQYVYRLSVTVLARARDLAASERRRLNSLNYGDLLNLSARVLRENAQVRHALQQKYRASVRRRVPGHRSGPGGDRVPARRDDADARQADWPPSTGATLPLRPGALFVVGDPKQSIYRFRRADIDIYNIVRERFSDPAIGRVLPLTMNFRSVPAAVRLGEPGIRDAFPRGAHDPFAALRRARSEGGGEQLRRRLHADARGRPPRGRWRRTPKRLRATSGPKSTPGAASSAISSSSPERSATASSRTRNALEALNIPIEVSGAGAFGKSAEVEALTVLLRALADPQDALSLVAVLRGRCSASATPSCSRSSRQAAGSASSPRPHRMRPPPPTDSRRPKL